MKSFQGIKEISATNVNIPHGDLLHVDGLWSFKKDEQTINVNTFSVSEITVKKMIHVKGHNCMINEVMVKLCPDVEYALYFENTKCQIEKISILNSKIKQTAISIHELVQKKKGPRRTGQEYKGGMDIRRQEMLKYTYNSPEKRRFEDYTGGIKGAFKLGDILPSRYQATIRKISIMWK